MSFIKTTLAVALLAAVHTGALAQKKTEPGSGGGSKVTVPAPLMVVDAAGKVIGRSAALGSNSSVALDYNGKVLILPLRAGLTDASGARSSGLDWQGSLLVYSGPDCTGTAYITASFGSPTMASAVKFGNQWIAHISAPGAVASGGYTLTSTRYPDGNCVNNTFATTTVVPVETTFSLDTYGIAPFYIQ